MVTNGQVGFLSGAIVVGSGFLALAISSSSEIGLMPLVLGIGIWIVVGVMKLVKS